MGYKSAQDNERVQPSAYQSVVGSEQLSRFRRIASDATPSPQSPLTSSYQSAAVSPAEKLKQEREAQRRAAQKRKRQEAELQAQKTQEAEARKIEAKQKGELEAKGKKFLANILKLDQFDADRMFFESLVENYDSSLDAAIDMVKQM